MLIGARTAAWAWSNPYITDGLIAMWDGEWNAGGGVHNASATTWIDLVGDCDCPVYTGTPTWEDQCFVGDRQTFFAGQSNAIGNAVVNGAFTLEMFINYRQTPTSIDSKRQQGQFGVMEGTTQLATAYRLLNPMWNWTTSFYTTYKGRESNGVSLTNTSCQCYFKSDNSSMIIGNSASMSRGTSTGSDFSITLGGFGVALGMTYSTYSRIYAIRFYNRVLSAAEIAYNYAIDKARFGLT